MIKKAASHRFPARVRVCVFVCLSVSISLRPLTQQFPTYWDSYFFCLLCLFRVGVSEFLSMSLFYTYASFSLFRFAFSKRRGREEVTADYYEYH
jgi:hypothetical protein